eukprot:TRINITY_DN16036_c0_g1_i1.p1 TRINITY_DN16036_c0_g1~~TRINITY_DN16036_c0_g1_i1.p1  ORF type:complete len:567 (+),score=70.52 TRINITY_DN16036_c0_g1_i1:225-1703(+)
MRVAVSMTGKVTFGSDASTILKKMRHDHPVTSVILSALETYRKLRGDGTAAWVLTLSTLVAQMASVPMKLAEVTRVQKVLSKKLSESLEHKTAAVSLSEARLLLTSSVLSTCCSTTINQSLTSLVLSLIKPCSINAIPDYPIYTSAGPLSSSRVYSGLIIDGRVIHKNMGMGSGKVLFLSSEPLIGSSKADKEIMTYQYDVSELSDSKKYTSKVCERFCKSISEFGYKVVLTSSAMPDDVATYAVTYSLLVIDSVSKDNIRRVAEMTSSPIWDATDVLFDEVTKAVAESSVLSASFAKISQELILISSPSVSVRSIVVCAPSEALRSDYVGYVEKVLTTLRFSEIGSSGETVKLLPGAGADFLAASNAIRLLLPNNKFADTLSQALDDVVCIRVTNTVQNLSVARHQVCRARQQGLGVVSTLPVLNYITQVTDCSQVMDPSSVNIFEPASGISYLIESVLSLFISLNRINGIYPSVSLSEESSDHITQTMLV